MNTGLHPSDIAIDRLRIRGSASVRKRLHRDLLLASWPKAKGDSWVFIRHLHIKAPARTLLRELTNTTRQQLDVAYHPSGNSNVVSFGSLTELLAYLLADLAKGDAAQRWYWQRWKHLFPLPPAQALQSLMSEYLFDMNAITRQLHHIQALAQVWRSLDDTHAQQLLADLHWKLGLRISGSLPNTVLQSPAGVDLAPLSSTLVSRWDPVLREISDRSPRYHLALVLMALESSPFILQHAPTQLLGWLHRQLHGPSTLPTPINLEFHSESELLIESSRAHLIPKTKSSNITDLQETVDPGQKNSQDSSKPLPTLKTFQGEKSQSLVTDTTPKESQQDKFPIPQLPETPPNLQKTKMEGYNPSPSPVSKENPAQAFKSAQIEMPLPMAMPSFDSFHTEQGGLFYLLNFLNRTETQRLMEDHWQSLPNGWAWLYRLGQELELDEQDPILEFLSQQHGLESAQELAFLPSLPAREELLEIAQQWYTKTQVWQPDLLTLSARVHYNPSHIDLYAALTSVRLPIRLAGLDINPGWIPWLGKVVNFHYEP